MELHAMPPTSSSSPANKRRSARHLLRLPIRFRTPDGREASGCSVDLSSQGAFIKTAELLPLGCVIQLEIQFEDECRTQRARVVRIFNVPFGEGGNRVTGIGVRFL